MSRDDQQHKCPEHMARATTLATQSLVDNILMFIKQCGREIYIQSAYGVNTSHFFCSLDVQLRGRIPRDSAVRKKGVFVFIFDLFMTQCWERPPMWSQIFFQKNSVSCRRCLLKNIYITYFVNRPMCKR